MHSICLGKPWFLPVRLCLIASNRRIGHSVTTTHFFAFVFWVTTRFRPVHQRQLSNIHSRGHGFGSLFSGLLRTVAPLIKRGAVALGKRALATGAQIAGDVVAGKNVKKAAKRRATAAGRNLMQSLLNTPPPPGKRVKRIKRTAPRRRVTPTKRRQRTDVFS